MTGGGYLREVRVPRMTLIKMKLRIDQLEREIADRVSGEILLRNDLRATAAALKITITMIDKLNRLPTQPPPRVLGEDLRNLEGARFMSITSSEPPALRIQSEGTQRGQEMRKGE